MSFSSTRATPCHTRQEAPCPGPGAARGPADPGKRMVGKVLTGNGITRYGNGAFSLIGGDELSERGKQRY